MEVDLAQGTQLVDMVPDLMISIEDFYNYSRLSVMTHGYEAWQGGDNLLVTIALVGRLSNTSYVGFQYNINDVIDHLTTNGVLAIPGERRTMEDLEGRSWHLRPIQEATVRVPARVAVTSHLDRKTSLRFEGCGRARPVRISADDCDREVVQDEDEETFLHTAACVYIEQMVQHENKTNCQCEECVHIRRSTHISYDVCFCDDFLDYEEKMQDEPLNQRRRSNKPKRKKGRWSTLGQPSGKWDYYVRYDIPTDITPIEEIVAAGWGDEFDDYSPTTIIVKECPSESSESEWENPFAKKHGRNIIQNSDDFDHEELPYPVKAEDPVEVNFHVHEQELPYPKFLKKVEELIKETAYMANGESSGSNFTYQPPKDSMMGPPIYPPADKEPPTGYGNGRADPQYFRGGYVMRRKLIHFYGVI